ncbi:MAG: electron transport complex subunit RsxE [Spirochaetes bacterium GWF1_31_7]|nr:MAG: electron transport complex subunit RsxE [Spirochaetes bacterium GWE1_32_154]OHD50931.1 MAG: electron transport complex subunit RsxE [Spirochaetes bacterium GWE2_31_10]OHD51228.1 MAG: electron transport complex subunit RsxE [Spirochaetes bacterium GWF1_31_7]OHD78595.1 MAG: electron transport complex subunit RsxE [Spirochaetes bacterium RIFOXYB1_FULL_32_8]HBI37416.1 electron transport complex subunit RsxE [Spirochaetia bacterium]
MDNVIIQENKSNSLFKKNILYFTNGLLKENPALILLLGMCPTLAVTTKVANGIGMGLATTFVLLFSNLLISLLRNFIPTKVRIPSYIVIIASFVTTIDLLMQAYLPLLTNSLGVFLPLIVVNCIILGRAEAFAGKNTAGKSILDALGMGLGFTFALILISLLREFPGTLKIDFSDFGLGILTFLKNADNPTLSIFRFNIYSGAKIFTMPAGAFFILGLILAFKQNIENKKKYGDK